MKHFIQNILLIAGVSIAFCACSHEEIDVYSADNNGVYFNYTSTSQLNTSINFAKHVLGNPQSLPVRLRLKIMGVKSSQDRKVVLKTKALEGYPMLNVSCPEVVFEADSVTKDITVDVMRPEERDNDYAAVIYIDTEDSESDINGTLKGFQDFEIHANETYTKPSEWSEWSMIQMYLGDWSAEKQIFFVNLTKNNEFYKSNDYYRIIDWNIQGVDSLRTWKQAHIDEPVNVEVPFINESGVKYNEPWYWNDMLTKYLGKYKSSCFSAICSSMGVTTKNEYDFFNVDEEGAKNLNKTAVTSMMRKYNNYYYDGWRSGSSYKSNFYIPMFQDMDYDVVMPASWSDNEGGADMIKKYYGDYSEAKYKFMIKTWLQHQGDNFVLNQMFPVMNQWGYVDWDSSIGGEDAIKACNKLFREAMAGSTYDFTFPSIE